MARCGRENLLYIFVKISCFKCPLRDLSSNAILLQSSSHNNLLDIGSVDVSSFEMLHERSRGATSKLSGEMKDSAIYIQLT